MWRLCNCFTFASRPCENAYSTEDLNCAIQTCTITLVARSLFLKLGRREFTLICLYSHLTQRLVAQIAAVINVKKLGYYPKGCQVLWKCIDNLRVQSKTSHYDTR